MTVRFREITCVQKTGTLITGIYGIIAPQSSDGLAEHGGFRANDEVRGPAWYKQELIQFLTLDNTKCFYIPDPDHPQRNLLDTFPTCDEQT